MIKSDFTFDSPICPECNFELWNPIADLSVSVLSLYSDNRFPGRCILALRNHYKDLSEVPDDVLQSYVLDQKNAAQAMKAAALELYPERTLERLNYAILGNTVPHVHTHIIPRYNDDLIPTRPIWEYPTKSEKLSAEEIELWKNHIKENLSK